MQRLLLIVLASVLVVAGSAALCRAETPAALCGRVNTDDTLRPVPDSLVPEINATFRSQMAAEAVTKQTVFRCVNGQVLACMTGANLPCGRADTTRAPGPGALAWCQDHPDAAFIPAVATGHETIYSWRCRNGAPLIVRQVQDVDARGFITRYWKELP